MSDCKICQAPIAHPTAIECFDCAMLSPERKAAAYAIARLPEYYDNRTPAWQSRGLIDRLRKMGFELTLTQQPTKSEFVTGIMDEVDAPDYVARPDRFFVDTLTSTGDLYCIPAARRAEWNAFDIWSEEIAEILPVPAWASPVAELSHLEFEMPQEIFK